MSLLLERSLFVCREHANSYSVLEDSRVGKSNVQQTVEESRCVHLGLTPYSPLSYEVTSRLTP